MIPLLPFLENIPWPDELRVLISHGKGHRPVTACLGGEWATSSVLQVTSYPINADQSFYAQAQFLFRKFERSACLNRCIYFEGIAKYLTSRSSLLPSLCSRKSQRQHDWQQQQTWPKALQQDISAILFVPTGFMWWFHIRLITIVIWLFALLCAAHQVRR